MNPAGGFRPATSDLDGPDESGEEDLLPLSAREVRIVKICREINDAVDEQDRERFERLDFELSVLRPYWREHVG